MTSIVETLRAENERLRAELVAEWSAAATARTGLVEPEIDHSRECGARCEHGGICTELPGHTGLHDASGMCSW